nr:MAG TPA: hypothetical protein [Caudoviricetes sp.]
MTSSNVNDFLFFRILDKLAGEIPIAVASCFCV